MSNPFTTYLYELSRTQPRDSRYEAFSAAMRCFDNGIVPMFVFSEEILQQARDTGELPEGAEPDALVIKFAPLSSRTGGQFAPPWYIATMLRKVADSLEEAGMNEFERWLEHERMEGGGLDRLERTLPDAEKRLEAIQGVENYLVALHAHDRVPTDGELEDVVARCVNLGVNLPVVEDPMQLQALLERLPELIHDEIRRTEARIQRTREQLIARGEDVDGFAGDGGAS